jgi:abortive infection bacteriophage resistance protein
MRILPVSHTETFIEHYYTKYGDPYLPPFWMTTQVLTMGALSRLFEGIGDVSLKLAIVQPFNVPAKVMSNWLHSLAHLRNICAHHGRLWNRVFSINPRVTARHTGVIRTPNRFEGHAVVLVDVLDVANPGHSWRQDFKVLLVQFPEIDPAAMGFDPNWETSPFWRT